jgi:hypothetical protein
VGSILLLPLNISPDSVVPEMPIADAITLCFAQETPLIGDFQIKLDSIVDCSGNVMGARKINLGSVSSPGYGSVLINEIMYDPQEGSIEFIELYNPGKEFFDIRDLSVDVVAQGESLREPVPLSRESRLLLPGEFLVISRNNQLLMNAYALEISGLWLQLEQLVPLSNSGGTVYLTDRGGNTVDMAEYSDRIHTEMLDHTKGVSLERISSDRPGSEPANWHSAASIEGYSTPGRQNSQSADYPGSSGPGSVDLLRVEPAVFSPDNDGYQDLLSIHVVTGREGEVISLWITDLSGHLVRNLASNHLTGPSNRYSWDGEREEGELCHEGFYVIHLMTYHEESGHSRQRKVAAGLIYR